MSTYNDRKQFGKENDRLTRFKKIDIVRIRMILVPKYKYNWCNKMS